MMFPELKDSMFSVAARLANKRRKQIAFLESNIEWVAKYSSDPNARTLARIALEEMRNWK